MDGIDSRVSDGLALMEEAHYVATSVDGDLGEAYRKYVSSAVF